MASPQLPLLGNQNSSQNFGVVFDSDLNVNSQIKAIATSAYDPLKNIVRIKISCLSATLKKKMSMNLFSVSCRKSILTSFTKKSIRLLLLIQSAAARVLTKTKGNDHTIPLLKSLHRLPVKEGIEFLRFYCKCMKHFKC